jgi:AcrR family transcriptional regulator
MSVQPTAVDRRAQRRAARRDANRTDILDAAEIVFGEDGLRGGSLRRIAAESGFSTAAIYLFFDNKQHLVADTLLRRGDELLAALRAAADAGLGPLDTLHRVVDVTIDFFAARPHFRRLLGHMRSASAIRGATLAPYGDDESTRFEDVMLLLAGLVEAGQSAGEIRAGDPRALAHLFSVLVNEHVLLSSGDATAGWLTAPELHGLIDGALRVSNT